MGKWEYPKIEDITGIEKLIKDLDTLPDYDEDEDTPRGDFHSDVYYDYADDTVWSVDDLLQNEWQEYHSDTIVCLEDRYFALDAEEKSNYRNHLYGLIRDAIDKNNQYYHDEDEED